MDLSQHIKISRVDKVFLEGPLGRIQGSLAITAHHLMFSPRPSLTANVNETDDMKEIWVLHQSLEVVEKRQLKPRGTPLFLKSKQFQYLLLIIPKEKDAQAVYESIKMLSCPGQLKELYAYSYQPPHIHDKVQEQSQFSILKQTIANKDGNVDRHFYDAFSDFQRMGLPDENWRYCDLNEHFRLCETYQRVLFVPKNSSDSIVKGCALFRSKNRLPVLSYVYGPTQASITRCSQPRVGIKKNRSEEDESFVQQIFQANPNKVAHHYIVDARPLVNAVANRAGGAGYESTDFYLNCKYVFLNIDNIHVMRESINKLTDACNLSLDLTTSRFLSAVSSSGWLGHIKTVLEAVVLIRTAVVEEGASVIIHCSDGWDRTAQLSSLSQLCLDPYYRTYLGFQQLICKEWLCLGHKFSSRCGFLSSDLKETSPVFTQFLDCVWQLFKQNESLFEFNENLLITLHNELFSSRYGTFFGNNVMTREKENIYNDTHSLWVFLDATKEKFLNPLYKPQDVTITPDVSPAQINLWTNLYCQYQSKILPNDCQRLHQEITNQSIRLRERDLIEESTSALQKKMEEHDQTFRKTIQRLIEQKKETKENEKIKLLEAALLKYETLPK